MKTKIYNTLTKPYIVILVMFLAPLLNLFDRNVSFFFGLGVALLILWSSSFNVTLFGLSKRLTKKTVVKALMLSVLILIAYVPVSIIIDQYFGEADLSSLDDLKHNTVGYILTLIIVWVFAAFGEELLFRGYYLKWLAELFGDSKTSWFISAIVVTIYFGVSHYYQGISGVLGIIPFAFIYALVFLKNKDNLWLLIFMHGFHDTIGLTFIYLDIENPIVKLFEQLLLN
ncbi:type II CAAX endopeptidase family protein [uncultured Lacinutrix sp.]|uniref:CPBP family intramembrane glutamic endopeptidase n=1 Tax=uncultured Lacinutrix sp. TaxID=574032 RepID=UPI00261D29AA|nr:type II CAAX endopeptidase family protein [uncultured Lacinutrix sp.]